MIFREVDFHLYNFGSTDQSREFRFTINYIIDSIFIRLKPLKIKTDKISKLNCYLSRNISGSDFWAVEGIGNSMVLSPTESYHSNLNERDSVRLVIETLRSGVEIAAKYDKGIESNLELILSIVNESMNEFEFIRKIGKSHRSRKYRCESLIRLKPNRYVSIVEVGDKSGNTERFEVGTFDPGLFFPIFPDSLRWDGDCVVGYFEEKEAFRLYPKIIDN